MKTQEIFFPLSMEVETKQFARFRIDSLLQVDFVNNISSRYKDVIVTKENYLIDNVENILSNKLTAVIGRDNPKDIFDIYLISTFYSFYWKDILVSAHKKAGFSNEDLVIRLKTFLRKMLNSIKFIDIDFLDKFDIEFPLIIEEIVCEAAHRAYLKEDK